MKPEPYRYIQELNFGLIGLSHPLWGRQMWVLAKMRKDHNCQITGEKIKNGAEVYRPMTNSGNRYLRISKAGMAILKGESNGKKAPQHAKK